MMRVPVATILFLGMMFATSDPTCSQEVTEVTLPPDTLTYSQPDSLGLIPDSIPRRPRPTDGILDSSKVYFFKNNFEILGPGFIKEIDTAITNVENYDPPFKPGNFYATLGNPGLAHVSMVYKPRFKSGFTFGMHSFDKYRFHNDSIHHYWVGRPYTHIFFIQGAKKEQNLHIDHYQNVASWFSVGLQFDYINSPGYYNNQEADDKNFVFKTRFQTRDYRYMVLANYIHNKLQIEENGGIVYDTTFTENVSPDRRGIDVNLSNANNFFKENTYYVKQLFKLSKRHRFRSDDTATQYASLIDRLNPGNLSLATLVSQKTYLYQQPNTDNNGFYPYTYDSINGTYDSTYTLSVENQLSWTNGDNAKYRLLTADFRLRHLYVEHSVDSTKTIYNQIIPTGMVRFKVSDILNLEFFGDIVLGNKLSGDFNLIAKLDLMTKFGNLQYELQNANQSVDAFYSYYRSNHFRWDNTFSKQYFLLNRVSYRYKSFKAGFNLFAIENFTYTDTLGFPAQLNSNLQVLQIYASKLFKLGNWSFDIRAAYQKASNDGGIRVPELVGDGSIYYTKDLFKEAAIIQTGIDILYNTAYYGYGYNPATRDFHIQNEKEIGDYAYANVFFNLQVKRSRLFVSYNNIGALLGDYRYFTVPDYPMRDAGFRFGVSWMFYD